MNKLMPNSQPHSNFHPSNKIHPTAIIAEKVIIGKNNYIGPYCIIGFPAEHRAFYEIGGNAVTIGSGNRFEGLVTVDAGTIGETFIGNSNIFLKHSHIGHDVLIKNNCTFSCGVKIGGECIVSDGNNFGLNSCVHQHSNVPVGCMFGMGTIVTKKTVLNSNKKYVGNPAREIGSNMIDKSNKTLIVQLCYGNTDEHIGIIRRNYLNAGCDFDWINVEEYPLSKALNKGLEKCIEGGYHSVMFLANDIEEPKDFLLLRKDKIAEGYGIVSLPVNSNITENTNGHLIGNYLISRETIKRIGYFTTKFDPYGPIDLDYCSRAQAAGIRIGYVLNQMATTGCLNGDKVYGYSKYEMAISHWDKHVESCSNHSQGKDLYEGPIIEMQQIYGED